MNRSPKRVSDAAAPQGSLASRAILQLFGCRGPPSSFPSGKSRICREAARHPRARKRSLLLDITLIHHQDFTSHSLYPYSTAAIISPLPLSPSLGNARSSYGAKVLSQRQIPVDRGVWSPGATLRSWEGGQPVGGCRKDRTP